MKNTLSLLSALAFCVSLCSAAETPEKIRFAGLQGFDAASILPQKAFKASKYVRLSGSVNLSGTAFVSEGSNYLHATLTGSTNLSGDGYQTGYTHITENLSSFTTGNYVSAYVQVNAYVSVYKNGKYVGSTYARGSVPVNGWLNGGFTHLSGFGTLSCELFVQED
ncbi:MAG TPA: hypothetical protein DCM05_06885 [Elusimicrobia bacterium]|nr:hypothetical protein [Elusimicrobiota bacterium]